MNTINIAVINTGGTISCTGRPLKPMTASAFAAAGQSILGPIIQQKYPNLKISYITDLPFPESFSQTLDSADLQPTDWCLIAGYILKHYSQYDGWVVLHGTDSMDFTGTALPFLLSSFTENGIPTAALSKPVVITGSQTPMYYQSPDTTNLNLNCNTDAFQNFCGAIAAAQTGIPEVCVYFHNTLFRGTRVLKINAREFKAFSSPNYPHLAEYGIDFSVAQSNVLPAPVSYAVSLDNPRVCADAMAQLNYIHENINNFPVMQLNAFPAWYKFDNEARACSGIIAQLIDACINTGIKGLILESYGEGNFPSGNPDTHHQGAAYQALANANRNGVIIVDCTKVIIGTVNANAYAAGSWLPSVGALSPCDMTPMAAFAKVMILLTMAGFQNWSLDTVKYLTQINLLGEMMPVNRLDSRVNSELLPGQSLSSVDGSAQLTNDLELGPCLNITATGANLWAALESPNPAEMPGRLTIQNDGNLVFYNRFNEPLWSTNTAVSNGAPSMLILKGSTSCNPVTLTVYDYSRGKTTCTLYS